LGNKLLGYLNRLAIAPIEQQFPLAILNLPAKLRARRPANKHGGAQIDEGERIPGRLRVQEGGGLRILDG
jgi:hypothetical protein